MFLAVAAIIMSVWAWIAIFIYIRRQVQIDKRVQNIEIVLLDSGITGDQNDEEAEKLAEGTFWQEFEGADGQVRHFRMRMDG